ncbi:MAG: beta-propeller domain-containing protein, partial [Bacillota bacterium]
KELKIPGYSAYLHPFDYTDANQETRHLLIGVGRDTDSQGRILGVQVSLFDVTSLDNPKRLGVYSYANTTTWNGASWTAAEWDHHAFSYYPQYQILTLPLVDYVTPSTPDDPTVGGLDVLKLDPENADPTKVITNLGRVEHIGQPQRSVRIGDFLYTLGTDAVKVAKLEDPTTPLAEVTMPARLSAGPTLLRLLGAQEVVPSIQTTEPSTTPAEAAAMLEEEPTDVLEEEPIEPL